MMWKRQNKTYHRSEKDNKIENAGEKMERPNDQGLERDVSDKVARKIRRYKGLVKVVDKVTMRREDGSEVTYNS